MFKTKAAEQQTQLLTPKRSKTFYVMRNDCTFLVANWNRQSNCYVFSWVPTIARHQASQFGDENTAKQFAEAAMSHYGQNSYEAIVIGFNKMM